MTFHTCCMYMHMYMYMYMCVRLCVWRCVCVHRCRGAGLGEVLERWGGSGGRWGELGEVMVR